MLFSITYCEKLNHFNSAAFNSVAELVNSDTMSG